METRGVDTQPRTQRHGSGWGLIPRPFSFEWTGPTTPVPWGRDPDAVEVDGRGVAVELRQVTSPEDLGSAAETHPWQVREAYGLEISDRGIRLSYVDREGAHRGAWTLRRMVRAGGGVLPCARILDRPAYRWRGLGLDIARHFFPPADLCRVMDVMEEVSLNVLHLHLSDDQGWRVEVPAQPRLVEESSGGAVGGDPGGFLSQADLALLEVEASRRGIALVPEVDVPGHTHAALHALPDLNPRGCPPPAYMGTEVGFSTLSTQAPGTAAFLDAVIDALAPFAAHGLHVGGDEPHVTAPGDYARLVGMALERVHDHNLRAVAWQEAAHLLAPGDLVQVWDEREDLSEVAAAGRRGVGVLLSPASRIYLDMKYDPATRIGTTWMGTTELRDSLEWDPRQIVPGLAGEAVEGVEACLWTETVRDMEDLTLLLLPRLAAAAEVAWAGSGVGEWDSFRSRILPLARSWHARGLVWHPSPGVDWQEATGVTHH